jgi:CelD/BcsL family acetyltransferase involved in cellulose biosynthesis
MGKIRRMQRPSIEILEDLPAQQALSEEWDAAVPQSYAAVLSRSPWYFAWRDAFPQKRSVVITARQDGRLVGVLPITRIRTDARGFYFSQVTTFTGGDYQLPVLATDASPDVLTAMIDAAIEYFGRRFVYWWANIPTIDPAATALEAHFRARGMRVTKDHRLAPRLELSGRSYSQVEASWLQKHRSNVRRQRKRLAAKGSIELWEPPDLVSAQALLEEFFVVHDEKWLSKGQPGRFQEARQRAHFHAIVNRLWGRGLHFSTLRCGGINVSYLFGFFSDGWIQSYRPTYRREYENLSPSKVHVALLVEEACRRGWRGIDFLQGTEEYKLQWSNQELRTVDFYATFRPWSAAYQWFTRVKPFVRNELGPLVSRTKARLQKASMSRPVQEDR